MSKRDTPGGVPSRREQLRAINNRALEAAITENCLRHVTDVDAARAAIALRLTALAKANANAFLNSGERVSIADMARGAIASFNFPARRFFLSGAKVDVGSTGALTLALILNELGSNAMRYGALSNAAGRVGIEWFVERVTRDFTLTWTEEGGPAVSAPARKGVGSRLIGQAFAGSLGGTAQMAFNRDGLVCVVCIPLDRLLED